MASKRILKKSINNLTYDLVSECFTYRHFHPDQNAGINEIIQDVVKTRNGLITKVNHAPKDKAEHSAYFKGVETEMRAMVSQLDKIDKLKK
jgi:hypothetical protein